MKNSRETLYGKGDNRRPQDSSKFDEGFDRIFRKDKKPERDDRKSIRAEKRVPSHND